MPSPKQPGIPKQPGSRGERFRMLETKQPYLTPPGSENWPVVNLASDCVATPSGTKGTHSPAGIPSAPRQALLWYLEGRPLAEIAGRLGYTPETVLDAIRRGADEVRHELAEPAPV